MNLGYHRPLAEKAVDAAVEDRRRAVRASFERRAEAGDYEKCRQVTDDRLVTAGARRRRRAVRGRPAPARRSTNTSARIASARTCRWRSPRRKQRNEPLDHVLLHGPPGLGKTTLAYVIAQRDGRRRCAPTSGPVIEKPGDLVGIAHEPRGARSAVHRRDPSHVAGDRGDSLSGARGLRGRHRHRPGPERAVGEGAAASSSR